MNWTIYLTAISIFLLIDAFWLGFIAKRFYRKEIGFLLSSNVNWVAAGLFYILFVFGLVFFVIEPAIKSEAWIDALFSGSLFGLVAYATYDLTNLATIEGWPLKVTIIDLIWGAFIGGSVSTITYLVAIELII